MPEAELLPFADAQAFADWLEINAERAEGVWLKLAKRGSGVPSMTSDEAVDVGLCFGWISGQRRSLDADWYLQKYVPRRPGSRWSQVNVEKVEALTAAGRMRPRGLVEVEAAQADGRWAAAYAPQSTAEVPAPLVEALAEAQLYEVFAGLGRGEQYQLMLPVLAARTDKARTAAVARAVAALGGDRPATRSSTRP